MENKQVLVDFSHESVLTSGKMIFLNDCFFLHPVLEEIWRSRDPWIYPPTLQSHDDWQRPKEHQSCFPSHGHIGITQPVAQKSWVTWSPGHPVTRSVSSRGVPAFKIDKNSAAVARRSASKYRGTGSIPGEFSATARSRHCYGSSLATSQHLKNGKKSPKNIKSQSTVLTSSVLFWFQNTNFQTIWLSMYGQVLVGTSRKPDLYWFVPWHCPKSPAPCMGFDSQSTIFRVTKNRCKSWCLSHPHHHCFPY